MSVTVRNMLSNTGRPIANQFIIYANDATYFQSYNTIIAKTTDRHFSGWAPARLTTLQTGYWNNYSATTNKYLNQFLGTSGIAEIREKVKNEEFKVEDI
jgi:hypothetical protein